eukprot:5484090-Amphidinium_carterae.1
MLESSNLLHLTLGEIVARAYANPRATVGSNSRLPSSPLAADYDRPRGDLLPACKAELVKFNVRRLGQ